MSILKTLGLHLLALFVVTLAPVIVYNWVDGSDFSHVAGLSFVGALTYPTYLAYWIAQIKSVRIKFVLAYVMGLVVITALVVGFSARIPADAILFIPAVLGVLPLLLAIIAASARRSHWAVTCLIALVPSLPLGMLISALLFYGAGMASVGNMRY
jgi:hypothetical protein